MTRRDRLLELLPVLLLPAVLFAAFFHLAILDPHNVGWLLIGSDNGENALGVHAWLNDPGAGWSLRTTQLNAPDGVALLFTDSNPLLTFAMSPIAALLAPGVQFVGCWFLASLILQTIFARRLLRHHAPTGATLWLGVALLLLLPTLYARYVHANLFAHWILLWALWIFVDPRRAGDARWWIAVLVTATLVHNYLLVMVGAIWASAMLERFVQADTRARLRLAGGAAVTLVAVALAITWLRISRDFAPSRTYGVFAMPLDALWNPSNGSYSTLLPATPQRLRRAFEGFQYLGAGLIGLLLAAPVIAARTPAPASVGALNRRLLWLLPACAALTLLAVSHQIDFAGRTIIEVPMARSIRALLDPVRASGRLFWPVAYVLALLAVTSVYRLEAGRARLLLGAALALQLADMTGMIRAVRHVTAVADDGITYHRTRDPRWTALIASARDVTFAPPDPTIALDLYQEIAWRAALAGRPVRIVYAARDTRSTQARVAAEYRDFAAGRLVPGRLYILFPEATLPPGVAPRVRTLDGVRVILASSPRSAS